MEVYLIKVESKKFSKRLYPETFGDLTLNLLGAIVKGAGHEPLLAKPSVLGRDPLRLDSTLENLMSDDPGKVICFSTNAGNIRDSVELARQISQRTNYNKIIFGGPTFDQLSSRIIMEDYPFIDYAVPGHGEKTLPRLLSTAVSGEIPTDVKGLFYRVNGAIVSSPGIELLSDTELDNIPFPLMTGLKNVPYKDRQHIKVLIRTSTGCNGFCTFCYLPVKKWSKMSAGKVGELFDHYTQEGFRKFIIIDDNFIGKNSERAREIALRLRATKESYPDFAFEFDARADSFGSYVDNQFDGGLINELKKSGLEKIFVGIESGNNDDLRLFRKSIKSVDALKQNVYFLEKIKTHNLEIIPGFVMLNENSTFSQVRENIDFIESYLPGQISPEIYCYTLSYYPGAELTRKKFSELVAKGETEKARELVYGNYEREYKDSRIRDFSVLLDQVKKRFSSLDEQLPDDEASLNRIKKVGNESLGAIHTKFFREYANMAETGRFYCTDSIIESHYHSVERIVKSSLSD